jgi:hypothetical protein
MTIYKNTVFIFKNMSAKYATLAAMLKHLRTRRKPSLNQIIFFSDEEKF